MGGLLSTASSKPSETQSQHATMSSKEASQTPESKQAEKETSEAKTLESQTPVQLVSDPPMYYPKPLEDQEPINVEEGDQEEEGECGFCLFMKGGGCRDSFIAWEKCIEEAGKNKEDIVDKCFEVTGLKKCMEAHSDYYTLILQAEKAVEEEAVRELEKEKANASGSLSSSSSSSNSEE